MTMHTDDFALSPASDLTVLELSDELLMVSKATGIETIRVVEYFEPIALRLRRVSAAKRVPQGSV